MSAFRHLPLGTRIPQNPHAVVTHLPTVADVIGYEERRPDTMESVRTGYPRFVQHPYVTAAARHVFLGSKLPTRAIFPVADTASAERVAALAGAADFGVIECDGWALLHLPPHDPDVVLRVKKIIQHTGVALTSRQAEDWLEERKLALPEVGGLGSEPDTAGFAAALRWTPEIAHAAVRTALAPLLAPVTTDDILLCRSGMNAFYAAFEAARALQAPHGRTRWLQLGWLYTDTTETLRKCLRADESFDFLPDVLDKAAVEKFFAANAGSIAAVVTEAPTNPLLQTPDLAWLSALARRHGALTILDPSTSGIVNVNLLPFADVLVTSLTKYASHEGDVMAGALAVNPASPHAAELRTAARRMIAPAYWRDMARLAAELETMRAVSARVNANTLRLAARLKTHPAVRRVRWALEDVSAKNYAAIARAADASGGMLTLELNIPFARFYDRARFVKGPSFGTGFTIVSPFIYMAHYDLVATAANRRKLLDCGIDPELIRVSVGAEPYEEIEAEFAEALAG